MGKKQVDESGQASVEEAAQKPLDFGPEPDAPDEGVQGEGVEGVEEEQQAQDEDDEPVEHEVLTQDAIFSEEHEVTKGDKGTEEEPVVKRKIGDRIMMKPSHARAHAERGVGLRRVKA